MEDLRWRTATIIVTAVAALEFVALAGAGVAIFGNPLVAHLSAGTARAAAPQTHPSAKPLPTRTTLTRRQTTVLVLNGNGRSGAAADAAAQLRMHGYRIGVVTNASRSDYAHTIVMYRRGYAAEGLRLGRDLHVRIVSPLDGTRPTGLGRAELVLIVGQS